jgi:hypothetical protein
MFRGAALQATMENVRMQGIHSLRVVLKGDSAEVFQREAEGRASVRQQSVADQMMATAAARHLPHVIAAKDQRDALINRLIEEFTTHPEYGSFADAHTARSVGIQQFKRLGQVFYFLSPFYSRIRTTHSLPTEFDFVNGFVTRSASSHKTKNIKLKQEDLLVQIKRVEHVLDAGCIKSKGFKFSVQITKLKDQLTKCHTRMLKQNQLVQNRQCQTSQPAARYDRATFALPRRSSSSAHLKYGDGIQAAVQGINGALAAAGSLLIVCDA